MKQKFLISGMSCTMCANTVNDSVKKLDGVSNVNVNLVNNLMTVSFDENKVNGRDIIKAVTNAGYKASYDIELKKGIDYKLLVTFIFFIPLFVLSILNMFKVDIPNLVLIELLLVLPIMIANYKIYFRGLKNIFTLRPNMDSLICLGSLASVIYGIVNYFTVNDKTILYIESAGMILVFVSIGHMFEARSKLKASNQIDSLIKLVPKEVLVKKNNEFVLTKIEDCEINDIIMAKPGDFIAIDGTVIEGEALLNTQAITGEAMPVEIKNGEKIISGYNVIDGYVVYKATSKSIDSTYNQIIDMVLGATNKSSNIERLVDKISYIFVPIVILIAVVTFFAWFLIGDDMSESFNFAISVLVISCPCALGLATPLALSAGIGMGAKNLILYKNFESIEKLSKCDSIAFDKTGTLTVGKPKLISLVNTSDKKDSEIIKIAASLEDKSNHPIAVAIKNENKEELYDVTNHKTVIGYGITGTINGNNYYIGINNSNNYQMSSVLKENDKDIATFAFEDYLRNNVKETLEELNKQYEMVVLSGDSKESVNNFCKQFPYLQGYGRMLPKDKAAYINEKSQTKKVLMIGDGINDSVALKSAYSSISFAFATDVSKDIADTIILSKDFIAVKTAIKLAKKISNNVKRSLFWAFIYNLIMIPLAMGILYYPFGIKLNPMIASLSMSLSSIMVCINALTLYLYKEKKHMKYELKVKDMMCKHCEAKIKDALVKLEGVSDINIDLAKHLVKINGDVDIDLVKKTITDLGYHVE